jgi:DNA-binding response OmpR family regulator
MARVLITDDTADIRHLLSALLVDEGHKVVVANDGAKALEVMRTEAPDLLVLDIMMPHVDGYGVLSAMKDSGLIDDVKVLILTAKSSEADWVRGYKMGADRYITKPFDGEEFLTSVKDLLGTSKDDLRALTSQELDKAQLLSRLETVFQDL